MEMVSTILMLMYSYHIPGQWYGMGYQLDMRDTNLRAVMNDVRQNPSSPFTYLCARNEEWDNGDLMRLWRMGISLTHPV